MDIPTLVVSPSGQHSHTVIFLHGRGDNVRNFTASLTHSRDSRGRTLADALPTFRWVFPQAPMRKCAASGDTWPQWFDVWNTRDFADREELQSEGLQESVPAICNILANEAALLGGHWDRIVLAGISMGAATGVHVLFNLEVPCNAGGRLAAFVGFSCRCPFAGRTLSGMRQALGLANTTPTSADGSASHSSVVCNTPILLEHCVDDPLVLVENGRSLRETLRGFGGQVQWKEYPSGGHWFNSPTGIDDVIDFLNVHVLT